jgi:hypothetical protein
MEEFSVGFWASLFLILAGAVAGKAIDIAIEMIKKSVPRIEYSTSDGIPIEVGESYYCGHDLRLKNVSKKKIDNVTVHLRCGDSLHAKEIEAPAGIEYSAAPQKGGLDLTLPYLKKGDVLSARLISTSKYVPPRHLGIAFSSPNDIRTKGVSGEPGAKGTAVGLRFAIAGGLAGFVIYLGSLGFARKPAPPFGFELDTRDVIMNAASAADLPELAEIYLRAPDPAYYDEGDLAVALARQASQRSDVEKYRLLLTLTIQNAPRTLLSESRANLFYSRGKLDLLLSDEKGALDDFRVAITDNRATVERQAGGDPGTRSFLNAHGLL